MEIQPEQDCFDGSAILRYRFDRPWRRESIQMLAGFGELDYFADFPRPFFRLRSPGGLEAKGVEGDDRCRVVLPRAGREQARAGWEALFITSQKTGEIAPILPDENSGDAN